MKVAYIEPNQSGELVKQGYNWTVVIVDSEDETDVLDVVDFKYYTEAEDYAYSINCPEGV